jgi:hypothetical protein
MTTRRACARPTICHSLGCALFVAVLGLSPRVAAGPAPEMPAARMVEVTPPACEAVSFPTVAFLDSLRVELAGRGLACCTLVDAGGEARTTAALRVSLELVPCAADGERVEAAVHDLSDGRVVAREITLSDVAQPARSRALALAVAELMRTLGHGARDEAPPPVATAAEASRPAPPPPPSSRQSGLALEVAGEARLLPARDTILWGGRVRVAVPWRALHVAIDLGGGYASAGAELGNVLLRSVSAGVGVGPRLSTRTAVVDVGVRAEAGWAWIHGETGLLDVRTGSGSDLTASAGVRASVALPARWMLRPCLALEGGFMLHGVKGEVNGQPVVGMTGYYLLAALGLGVVP